MADDDSESSADGGAARDDLGGSDGEVSDFEVEHDEEEPRRPRGRPRGAGRQPRGAGRPNGQHGARGGLSPAEERDRASRDRRQPQSFATEQARQHRRAEKKRKRDIADAVADSVFDMNSIFNVRTLATSIAENFKSGCCGAALKPLAPSVITGAHVMDLPFECLDCGKTRYARTGKKVRLPLDVTESTDAESEGQEEEPDEESEDEEDGGGRRKRKRKKQKRRKFTNGRHYETVAEVLACLLTGQMYSQYKSGQVARGMPYVHHSTFDRLVGRLMPIIEKLTKETVDLVRYLIVRYCNVDHLVVTADWFWQVRGHHSPNGSGSVCDRETGAVLAYKHLCQGSDDQSDRGGFEFTSHAMDAKGCAAMMDELIQWMEGGELDDLLTEHAPNAEAPPSLDGAVLDGDASTNSLIPVMLEKQRHMKATNYCSSFKLYKCGNHLAKNVGKQALKIGVEVHRTCSCADNLTLAKTINKTKPKKHRGLSNESDPLIKAFQRATSAALRGASAWKSKAEYANEKLSDLAIHGLEEMMLHLRNTHEGSGFYTGKPRKCRLHDHTTADGKAYAASQSNDCGDFNQRMEEWLTKEIIEQIDDVVHPVNGVMTQNSSERVGTVALRFRDKERPLKPTHYIASTSLAIAHVNNTVIHAIRSRLLEQLGEIDARIEDFGTYQQRLFELCRMQPSVDQKKEWLDMARIRAKRSLARRDVEYKRKRKKQRTATTKARAALKRDNKATYKGQGGTADNGVAGACKCRNTSTCARGSADKGCPCRAEGVLCTSDCHPSRPPTAKPCSNLTGSAGPSQPAADDGDDDDDDDDSDADFDDADMERPVIDDTLVGRCIRFHWDSIGWYVGEIEKPNVDPTELDTNFHNEVSNYIVYYEADDTDHPHYLDLADWSTKRGAPSCSWHLLKD